MPRISVKSKGSFKNFERFYKNVKQRKYLAGLEKFGEAGVNALSMATPIDSGETAVSWGYHIEEIPDGYKIVWTNDNINENCVIAILLQYGHGTGTGGYVEGQDYINPAMRDIFNQIAEDAWREVTK